eukprot:7192866-Karenia_brevis.AAC.1
MITGSDRSAWIMMKQKPKKIVKLANPMIAASKNEGRTLAPSSPNMNLGEEHINMSRQVYDLRGALPDTALTEEQWPKFLRALLHLMSEETVDDMWQYASK